VGHQESADEKATMSLHKRKIDEASPSEPEATEFPKEFHDDGTTMSLFHELQIDRAIPRCISTGVRVSVVAEFPKVVPGHKELLSIPYALSKAKCSQSLEQLIVYERQNASEQLAYMNKERIGLIRGPPGCGKSTIAWYFVLQYAQRYPEDIVCWVQAATRKRIILHHNTIHEDRPDPEQFHQAGDAIVTVLCIVGGTDRYLREVTHEALSTVGKIMIVNSVQGFLKQPKFISERCRSTRRPASTLPSLPK
jgi:hypothetical protein